MVAYDVADVALTRNPAAPHHQPLDAPGVSPELLHGAGPEGVTGRDEDPEQDQVRKGIYATISV